MTEPVVLRAMFGQDETNHGTTRYRVSCNGLVTVSPEAAIYLAKNGGFVATTPTAARSSKLLSCVPEAIPPVGLRHPSATGCSYGGVEYHPDKSGVIFVPFDAVADLTAHGFSPLQQDEAG
jgi:hypothetical protein